MTATQQIFHGEVLLWKGDEACIITLTGVLAIAGNRP